MSEGRGGPGYRRDAVRLWGQFHADADADASRLVAHADSCRRLFVARSAGLGGRTTARMVSFPGELPANVNRQDLFVSRGVYRRLDRNRAKPAARSFLHLSDLYCRRERLLFVGVERRVRRPALRGSGRAARIRVRGI